MKIRYLLPLIIVFSFLINCQESEQDKKVILKIGHINVTDHLTLGISDNRDKDKFSGIDLQPTSFSDWEKLQEAFLDGSINGAFVLAPLAMEIEKILNNRGKATNIVLLGHRDGSTLMIGTGSDINKVSDLRGKTIAIPSIYSMQNILLHKLVLNNNLDYYNDIKTMVMAPKDMPFSLIAKEMDGYIVAEPYGAQIEEYEFGKIFRLSRQIKAHHICCVLQMDKTLVEKSPQAVQELVNSLVESGLFIENSPYKAATIGCRFLMQSKETLSRVLTVPQERVCYYHLIPDTEDFIFVQDYLVDTMKINNDKVDINNCVLPQFAKKAYQQIDAEIPPFED
jgi:NitT/TauT family transport system substrate-binding protein